MCDQTEVSYLEDDVVWVKIGPIWWPGVVKDLEKDEEGREILAGLKKKPIAVVKFFQEDNYEFVKNLEHIYHYSCRRKDEFIKKGLDKFRTGASHMKKFPADVTTAESLTNGDINIINDPKFFPEKKESYSEIFGSGKKKSKKESDISPKVRTKTPTSVTPYRPITHQRFINKVLHGESDHKVKTLIQNNPSADDGMTKNLYRCHICKFETSRVNVIVAHHRLSHSLKNSINWTGSDSKLVRKKPMFKPRKIKSKKLYETSKDDISDKEEDEPEKKKSPKNKIPKEKAKSLKKSESTSVSPLKKKSKDENLGMPDSKKPRFTDVLLADWNEDEEEGKQQESNTEDITDTEIKDKDSKNEDISETTNETPSSPSEKKNEREKMSCFDFDEEEDGFIGMSNANTYGRKIPRVIPVKDKPELGMDLDFDDLFKKKSDGELENSQDSLDLDAEKKTDVETEKQDEDQEKEKKEKPGRRRRSKASKDEEVKLNAEDSLALRRTRRPGAKKSYLNEVIEKIDDQSDQSDLSEKKKTISEKDSTKVDVVKPKEETGSSSRRKQDFKHTMDSDREEVIYSDMVSNEQKSKAQVEKKTKSTKDSRRQTSDDLTAQIDNLLEETKVSSVPANIDHSLTKNENIEKSDSANEGNTTSFSFDYLPAEQTGKKGSKPRSEVKSISRMFSDSIPSSDTVSEPASDFQSATESSDLKDSGDNKVSVDSNLSKNVNIATLKLPAVSSTSQKRGSIVLSTVPKSSETKVGQLKVLPVVRQGSKDCIVLPTGKKVDMKSVHEDDEQNVSDPGTAPRSRNIKAIKVKSDSLPQSLLAAGKLKRQTIIHQKGGKYVIVTQPPQSGRQRATPGKVQSGSKVVILTNQLGEQKIITTSGLQQSKFKVDGQKIITASDSEKEGNTSTSLGQAHPVIKMVPDGKGGIMKQLTVSPKKVLVGGTKVLVSGSGSTLASGNSVQKIALSGSGNVARTASGDFRLIENYKGSGKTVLIQGGSNSTSGVVLKSSVMPRQVTKVIQSPQTVSALKKKPKILMRASSGQGEYVMQSTSESPTIVVKQKGSDGKFSTQKIVRTEIVNQPKASTSTPTKTFFVSGQGGNQKGESYIITTNESVPSKVIRMRPKIKEVDVSSPKSAQKIVQKSPEVYSIPENSLVISNQGSTESDTPQIVQVPDQLQPTVLQTQVIAMPGPVGADGNQTYVLVSVDENGVVQGMDNSVVAFDSSTQSDQIFVNPTSTANVILLNSQANEEVTPVYSSSGQDILAEALANTNVLEGSINNEIDTVVPPLLLPPSIPSSVVQETSITLQKPIMTPLEMPSSVAPDTSVLEPPPLPPTPTEEDVLMEETETPEENVNQEQNDVDEKEETGTSETIQTYIQSETFDSGESGFHITSDNQKMFEQQYESTPSCVEIEEKKLPEGVESTDESSTKAEYTMEIVQEEQSTTSFQSLPVLNDEPDTSDDAQNPEPTADQQFETEKSEEHLVPREQEPPSSTNNEIITENTSERRVEVSNYEISESKESNLKMKETEETQGVEENTLTDCGQKEKENAAITENHSLPVIMDESTNSYEMDASYSDVISQKRFQEETEVSSTTDEFANKESGN